MALRSRETRRAFETNVLTGRSGIPLRTARFLSLLYQTALPGCCAKLLCRTALPGCCAGLLCRAALYETPALHRNLPARSKRQHSTGSGFASIRLLPY